MYSSFLRLKPPMDPVPSLRTRAVLAPKVVAFCSAAIRAIKARRVPLLSWTYLEGTTWAGGIYSHPVGKLWKMAIEIVDLPSYKWWFSIVMLVYQVAIQLGNQEGWNMMKFGHVGISLILFLELQIKARAFETYFPPCMQILGKLTRGNSSRKWRSWVGNHTPLFRHAAIHIEFI